MAAADEPLYVAVTVADWSERSEVVLIVKVEELVLGATWVADGTVSTDGALPESATVVSLLAFFDKLTVQVVLVFEVRLLGAHCTLETVIGAVRETVTD